VAGSCEYGDEPSGSGWVRLYNVIERSKGKWTEVVSQTCEANFSVPSPPVRILFICVLLSQQSETHQTAVRQGKITN
jgi:hypothetical protein